MAQIDRVHNQKTGFLVRGEGTVVVPAYNDPKKSITIFIEEEY